MVSELDLNTMPEALCRSSNLNEVLWNFGRFKDKRRLTLKQNPHFYDVLPEKYGSNFRTDPIETFQRERISVLTDNSGQAGRVYIQVAKKTRVFGNVWALKDAFIFKGLSFLSILSLSLTLCQISLERLRAKALLAQLFKTHLTYGVLKSLRGLTPPRRRFRRL